MRITALSNETGVLSMKRFALLTAFLPIKPAPAMSTGAVSACWNCADYKSFLIRLNNQLTVQLLIDQLANGHLRSTEVTCIKKPQLVDSWDACQAYFAYSRLTVQEHHQAVWHGHVCNICLKCRARRPV